MIRVSDFFCELFFRNFLNSPKNIQQMKEKLQSPIMVIFQFYGLPGFTKNLIFEHDFKLD